VYSQDNYQLSIPEHRFKVDEKHQLVICKIDLTALPDLSSYTSVSLVLDDQSFEFVQSPDLIDHKTVYEITRQDKTYSLYFSAIPLVSIHSDMPIVDEPKRLSNFSFADDNEIKTSLLGIELRGGSSQFHPKKTYDLEFWEDELGEDNKDMQFGNLREDDDWILDGLYNEPLRLRAFSSHKLWLDMHEPYYLEDEDEAKSGADVMFVDLVINDEYVGVYMLSEQVDRKQLKLKKFKNGEIRGELYKSNTWQHSNSLFFRLLSYDNELATWGDYEVKLPDPEDAIDWKPLYDFTDFVINSPLETFHQSIGQAVYIENAIDYFIFINITRARDNTGKNIYTAKYAQDEPYFFVPWDLDGVFGNDWRGEKDTAYDDVLTNGLFNRLLKNTPTEALKTQLKNRWFELRETVLSDAAISSRLLDNYTFLKDNKIYDRESKIWTNYDFQSDSRDYMMNWLANRLEFLDAHFNEALNVETFGDANSTDIKIYPNPVKDILSVKLKKEASYQLFNVHGVLLQTGILNRTNTSIHLKTYTNGVYFLNMNTKTFKIIKN
jgi:hypothetical protein